jgi:hypothetical protein
VSFTRSGGLASRLQLSFTRSGGLASRLQSPVALITVVTRTREKLKVLPELVVVEVKKGWGTVQKTGW